MNNVKNKGHCEFFELKNIELLQYEGRLFISLLSYGFMCGIGEYKWTKEELADKIGCGKSSVTNYLIKFAQMNFIKFKYSGKLIINPDVVCPDETKLDEYREQYKNFKSDINVEVS